MEGGPWLEMGSQTGVVVSKFWWMAVKSKFLQFFFWGKTVWLSNHKKNAYVFASESWDITGPRFGTQSIIQSHLVRGFRPSLDMSPIWVHCYMLMLCLEIYCPIRWFGDTTQKLSNYCTSTCTSEPEAEPVTTSYMFSGSFSKQSSIYTHIYIYQKTHSQAWLA